MNMTRSAGRLLGALIAGVSIAGNALAQDPSGTTVAVDPAAAASGATGTRTLAVNGPIFMGDQINTDVGGQAQILFVDDTKFVVGPNSKVLIDAFVFNPDKTAQEVGLEAVKGTFRFITGASPKNVYAVRTPTMTVGVRGTVFDLAVRPGGESTIALHEGGADICDARQSCMAINPGSVVVAPPGGGFQSLTGTARTQRLNLFFPFVRAQTRLQPAFRVANTPISTNDNGGDDEDRDSGEQKGGGAPDNNPPDRGGDNGGGDDGGGDGTPPD